MKDSLPTLQSNVRPSNSPTSLLFGVRLGVGLSASLDLCLGVPPFHENGGGGGIRLPSSPFKLVSLFAFDLPLGVFVMHHVLGILFFWGLRWCDLLPIIANGSLCCESAKAV